MPFIVRGLGPERFGVLGIVWVVFGYFSLFDLGLGRATTKFLAEARANRTMREVPGLVWTSLAVQLGFGALGGTILAALSPTLAGSIWKVPPHLVRETTVTFWILGASLPLVLATNGLRATLEGCQRFDLTNLLKIPGAAVVFLIPAMASPFGLRLPAIVLLLLISRLLLAIAHFVCCVRVLPELIGAFVLDSRTARQLLFFGGWVTVANIVNPILIYLDRFLIASILSVVVVGYYVAPFEALTRLWVIPASLAATLFPACSAIGIRRHDRLQELYSRSLKYLLLVLAPIVIVLFAFAGDIINLWLGADYRAKSTIIMQILAVGVFVNCFAHVPYTFLQSLGRPDVTAKLFLAELPIYGVLAWWVIHSHGVIGAAAAWSVRVAVEVLLLMLLARALFSLSPRFSRRTGLLRGSIASFGLFFLIGATVLLLHGALWLQACVCAIWVAGFAFISWQFVFDNADRDTVLTLVNPLVSVLRKSSTGG